MQLLRLCDLNYNIVVFYVNVLTGFKSVLHAYYAILTIYRFGNVIIADQCQPPCYLEKLNLGYLNDVLGGVIIPKI